MDVATLRAFLGWCTLINSAFLVIAFGCCSLAADRIYRIHSAIFPMPRETFTAVIYCFIGGMKVLVLMFNAVPYAALVLAG